MPTPRGLTWRELPPQLNDAYARYSWGGHEKAAAFAYESVMEWKNISAHFMDLAYRRIATLDPRLHAQEKEFIDKMSVCWRLTGYGMLHEPEPSKYSCSNPDQARVLRPHFRKRATQYIARLKTWGRAACADLINNGPVKLDRGKGAPYWSPRTDRAVAIAYARLAQDALDHDDIEKRVMRAGNAILPFCQTSYVRIDRSRKDVPVWKIHEGRLVSAGKAPGPKVRRIGAMPFAINHLWAGVGNLLRTAMADIDDRNTGTLQPSLNAAAEYKYTVAVDLSSYDTTVGIETLDALREEMLAPILYYLVSMGVLSGQFVTLLLDCDAHMQHYDILVPPWEQRYSAMLVPAVGQIRSGENLTSWKGTEINRNRYDAKGASLGIKPSDARGFNYGDDTVLMTNSASTIDKWAKDEEWHGFVETVAPDATFLMRRLPYNYGYYGRLLGACIDRESHQEPANIIAAAASFATRAELLQGHPLGSDFIRDLATWRRSARWNAAVSLAGSGVSSAVQLAQTAATWALASKAAMNVDMYTEQLAAVARAGNTKADSALNAVVSMLERQQRQVSWTQLQTSAAELTMKQAETEIKSRSYTIRRDKNAA